MLEGLEYSPWDISPDRYYNQNSLHYACPTGLCIHISFSLIEFYGIILTNDS